MKHLDRECNSISRLGRIIPSLNTRIGRSMQMVVL
nr:MAG TPA: hypothetical protein [Caudoviricetes sp.]